MAARSLRDDTSAIDEAGGAQLFQGEHRRPGSAG